MHDENLMPLIDTQHGPINISDHRRDDSEYPPMLLVHGAGASRLVWPAELRRLPPTGAIAVDLPGHGKSPGPASDTIDAYAAALIALLDALGIEQVITCGHSMGGAVVQQMALNHPDRVAGLVLVATGAKLRVHPDLLALSQHDLSAAAARLDDWMWGDQADTSLKALARKELIALPPGTLHSDYRACDAFDSRNHLSHIVAPTLVIAGSSDRMTPPKFSATLAASIPHAESVTIAGTGHYIILEQPEAVAQAVTGWLNRHLKTFTQDRSLNH